MESATRSDRIKEPIRKLVQIVDGLAENQIIVHKAMNTLNRNVKESQKDMNLEKLTTTTGTQTRDTPTVTANKQLTSSLSTQVPIAISHSNIGVQTPFWWSYNHGDNASELEPVTLSRQRKK